MPVLQVSLPNCREDTCKQFFFFLVTLNRQIRNNVSFRKNFIISNEIKFKKINISSRADFICKQEKQQREVLSEYFNECL